MQTGIDEEQTVNKENSSNAKEQSLYVATFTDFSSLIWKVNDKGKVALIGQRFAPIISFLSDGKTLYDVSYRDVFKTLENEFIASDTRSGLFTSCCMHKGHIYAVAREGCYDIYNYRIFGASCGQTEDRKLSFDFHNISEICSHEGEMYGAKGRYLFEKCPGSDRWAHISTTPDFTDHSQFDAYKTQIIAMHSHKGKLYYAVDTPEGYHIHTLGNDENDILIKGRSHLIKFYTLGDRLYYHTGKSIYELRNDNCDGGSYQKVFLAKRVHGDGGIESLCTWNGVLMDATAKKIRKTLDPGYELNFTEENPHPAAFGAKWHSLISAITAF